MEIGDNSSYIIPLSPFSVFFTYIARFSKRAPLLLFSLESVSNDSRVFFFLLFHFVFERGRRGNGSVEKTIFLFFFALLFFLKEMEKGNRRRRRIDFRSFFLEFSERRTERRREVVEKKFLYFSFFLLFERRENGRIRFFFRFGFSF